MRNFCLSRQLDKGKIWLAIACTFIIPIIIYVASYVRVEKQVNINTDRLTLIENQYRIWKQ